ncbi:MAG: prolipoprotein diacylglyceryl transferase [Armatimonadetes bacterium]|nr:prolipoprotein diacylglyceryl transferase [Armatimonadota bacterium]
MPGFISREGVRASFAILLLGIIGARVVFILQSLEYYRQNPQELWTLQFRGLTSFGGLIFGFFAAWGFAWRAKKPLLALLDTAAVPVLIGHAIGRVGCLLNGCCYGGVCDLPWGIHVEGYSELHHPAQIYDSLMLVAGAWILHRIEKKGLALGQSFAAMLVVYGVARFAYEFFRAGVTSTTIANLPLTEAHIAAAVMAILGIGLYAVWGRRNGAKPDLSTEDPAPSQG